MNLQQLRYFCVMAEVLHYTKAANQLYITQPSLSHALSEMEKELGVPLFEKHGKKNFLTKYGAAFLPYAKNALHELSNGEAVLCQMADPTVGSIDLGYIYSVSFDFLPQVVEKFYLHQGNHNISFSFTVGMTQLLMERLMEGSLDFIFTTRPDNPLVESLPVFEQELFLVVPKHHPLAAREAVSLSEVKDEKFISINPNTALRMQIDGFFRAAGYTQNTVFEVDECNAMAAFVSSQMGIAIMPRIPSLSQYRVSLVKIIEPSLKREICLLWKKGRHMVPSVRCFQEFILHNRPFNVDSVY